eukprot:Gb_30269 [translate_table: standard]
MLSKTGEFDIPYPFVTSDAAKVASKTYDYIIVGGGTAGCPLAAILSTNYSVLVVERGGSPYGVPDIENENAYQKPLRESDKYTSIAQTFISEDGLAGGARARSYEWVEKELAFAPEQLTLWQSTFKDALLEVGVLPSNGYTLDHVEGTKISASIFDKNGIRHTAADLLKYANFNNIVVLLNSTTKRILFNQSGLGYYKE